jgi:ATP-binding cassette subfamily B multidrug efflux pump
VDINTVIRRKLRSRMGMVLQDTWLFGGSIRNNINTARLMLPRGEILKAAKATHVNRLVHSLAEGSDTLLKC